MKKFSIRFFLHSISSLVVLGSMSAFAQQDAYVPTLEGGMTASIGTFYAAPGSDNQPYADSLVIDSEDEVLVLTPHYNQTDYDWGFEAALGYVFDDTANGIELSYRGFNSDSNSSTVAGEGVTIAPHGLPISGFDTASNQLTTEFNSVDLMVSQFLDVGNYVQMRFSGGLAYVRIEQENKTIFNVTEKAITGEEQSNSTYQGWGPRLAIDARYDFGQGFGIVGGGSAAYFIGDLDSDANFNEDLEGDEKSIYGFEDDNNNHTVLNLRGNLGVDYVYFFDNEERSSLGLEVGYMADYYAEAVNELSGTFQSIGVAAESKLLSASFMGPYANLKGVF